MEEKRVVKYDVQAEDSFSSTFDGLSAKMDVTDAQFRAANDSAALWEKSAGTSARAWTDAFGKVAGGAKNLAVEVDKQYTAIDKESKLAATAIAVGIGVILAGTVVGALYTVYKVVKETTGFIVGLLTGASYKNKYAEELLKAADANRELAKTHEISAAAASAYNEALLWTGKTVENVTEVTTKQLNEAASRLAEYQLLLGPKQMKAAEEFATATREFNHNAELTGQGFRRAIGDTVMPLLTDLADFFKDGFPTAVRFFRAVLAQGATVVQGFVNGIYVITEPLVALFSVLGTTITTTFSAAWKAIKGDFVGAQKVLDDGRKEIRDRWGEAWDNIAARSQRTADNISMAWGVDDKGPIGAIKKAAEGISKEMESLLSRLENTATGVNSTFFKELAGLNELREKDLITEERYAAVVAELINQTKYGTEVIRARTEAEREAAQLKKDSDRELQSAKEWVTQRREELGIQRKLTEGEKRLAEVLAGKYDKYLPVVKETNKQLALEVIQLEKVAQKRKVAADMLEQYIIGVEAVNAINEQGLQISRAIEEQFKRDADDLQFQIDLLGKTELEIQQLTAARRIDQQVRQQIAALPPIDADGNVDGNALTRILAAGEKAKKIIPDLLAQNNALREQQGLWSDIATGAGNFFSDLVMNGKSAFDRLKDSLKSFVGELIALFAKKWILNIVGQGSLADVAGQGTVAGSLLQGAGLMSNLTSLVTKIPFIGTTAGGFMSGVQAGWQGMALPGQAGFMGPVLPGTTAGGAAGFGQSVGSFAQAAAPYMAALAAVLVTTSQFKKWGNDTTGKVGVLGGAAGGGTIGFMLGGPIGAAIGAALGALTGGRLFGRGAVNMDASGLQGSITGSSFAGQLWQDKSQKGGLFRSDKRWTDVTDMTGEQASIFASLTSSFRDVLKNIGGMLGKDADDLLKGFTASFKITTKDRSDEEIQKDINDFFDKVFRDQLGLVLAGTEADLMKYIDGFKGTTAELIDFASAVAGIAAVLPKLDIKGLSFESLDALAASGENIVQTFARITGQLAAANAVFETEADNLRRAQQLVDDYFASLGQTVPANVDAFKAWIATIDLSTEAGRLALNTLGEVPNAFKLIADASKSMVSTMGGLLQSIYGGTYGKQIAQSAFDAAANQWNQYLTSIGVGTPGYSASQTYQDLLTNPALAGQVFELVQNGTLSTEAGNIFNSLLSAFQTLQQAIAGSNGATGSVVDLGNSAANAARQLQDQRNSIADYLRRSITSEQSPLDPMQRYLEAKGQFNSQLALATGGNLEAMSSITSYFENFINLSRQVNGSNGQYNIDYFGGYNGLAGLTGGQVQPYTNNTALAIWAEQKALMQEMRDEARANKEATIALGRWLAEQGIEVHSPEIVEAIEDNAPEPSGSGFLQSTRTPGLA